MSPKCLQIIILFYELDDLMIILAVYQYHLKLAVIYDALHFQAIAVASALCALAEATNPLPCIVYLDRPNSSSLLDDKPLMSSINSFFVKYKW